MIGDFNEIHSSNEKFGGRSFESNSHCYLDNFMDITGSIDLGFQGNVFTWRNNRVGLGHIRQRLDRALSNDSWKFMYPNLTVTHLPKSNSDHNPTLLNLFQKQHNKPYPFRFIAAWIRDSTCLGVVSRA